MATTNGDKYEITSGTGSTFDDHGLTINYVSVPLSRAPEFTYQDAVKKQPSWVKFQNNFNRRGKRK